MGLLKTKRDGKLVAYRLDKAAIILGSGENCNIRVADAGLVARHCQILKMENGFVLRDMSGDIGTFVNGKKIKEHLLSDRDLIQVGKERFTFSISAGENTARVAVSVAPGTSSVPKSGGTARVAAVAPAAPARTGNTGRIAPAAPKTDRTEAAGRATGRMPAPAASESSSRSTGRVNKATQRTATVQKSTGRVEGSTRKITARTAAAMGYQTQRSTFALPSTRKGKIIAFGGVFLILAIGGIFYGINASKVKPEEVKAVMRKEWADVQKLKPGQEIEMDNLIERILAEHEPVRRYVNEDYTKYEKEHTKVHQIASEQKKAAKDVKPFLDKYSAIKAKPADLKAQAQTLYDECKSQNDNYGGTVFGPQLQDILKELQGILADTGPTWEQGMVGVQSEVRAAAKKGDFVGASKTINEYGEKFKEKEVLELFKKLTEQRDFLKRESVAFVNRETVKAQKDLATEGTKKDEVKKRLEAFKPGLEGFKEALEKLDAAIAGIK
ncbi:MAG TPA: FHA domain-containing protein [Planctomycetota bacterium]|nr:FHA domain-containing protein [Planctomycetota bacterium]